MEIITFNHPSANGSSPKNQVYIHWRFIKRYFFKSFFFWKRVSHPQMPNRKNKLHMQFGPENNVQCKRLRQKINIASLIMENAKLRLSLFFR
jgi:hypothetical protein